MIENKWIFIKNPTDKKFKEIKNKNTVQIISSAICRSNEEFQDGGRERVFSMYKKIHKKVS